MSLFYVLVALCLQTVHGFISKPAAMLLEQQTGTEGGNTLMRSEQKRAVKHFSLMKHRLPWFHSTDEIRAEVQRLAQNCNGALSVSTVSDSGVEIDTMNVKKQDANATNKVFMIFGEHSRELITTESGLYFLQLLCGEAPEASDEDKLLAASALEDSEFQLVLNGNPRSRQKVEQGEYCLRTNPGGVDLNRNWDEKWGKTSQQDDATTYGGPTPFSEPETRLHRQLVSEFMPNAFLSIHSGTRGLYMPWAFDTVDMASRNKVNMLDVLRTVDEQYCKCPYGAAGKEVLYACPGTSLDWVYDHLNASYSFAWEIYAAPEEDRGLSARWQEELQHAPSLIQTDSMPKRESDGDQCLRSFNPTTEGEYKTLVRNWALAYVAAAKQIAAKTHAADSGA